MGFEILFFSFIWFSVSFFLMIRVKNNIIVCCCLFQYKTYNVAEEWTSKKPINNATVPGLKSYFHANEFDYEC